jgi:GTPase SAR1 family protein
VIVFDITNRESYEGVEQWRNNFLESVRCIDDNQSLSNDELIVPIILVGNKYDIAQSNNRQVDTR